MTMPAAPVYHLGKGARHLSTLWAVTDMEADILDEVVAIWSSVLLQNRGSIHPDAHFLLQGGDSLQLARILSRLREQLGVELLLHELVRFSTARKMAHCVLEYRHGKSQEKVAEHNLACSSPGNPSHKADRNEISYPATSMQQGLWYAEQLSGQESLYANAVLVHFKGALDRAALQHSLAHLRESFPVLRSRFLLARQQQSLYAHCRDPEMNTLPELTIVHCDAAKLPALAEQALTQPFQIGAGDLFRAVLYVSGEQSFHLLLCCHHLVCDGWSGSLILQRLALAYSKFVKEGKVPEPSVDTAFVDYAHKELATSKAGLPLQQELAWWRKQLAGAEQLQQWIWPEPSAAPWPHQVAHLYVVIPLPLVERCTRNAGIAGVSLFIFMQWVCKLALQRISGCDDQILGIPVSERALQEENSVGCYVKLLLSRTSFSGTSFSNSDRSGNDCSTRIIPGGTELTALLQQESASFHAARQQLLPLAQLVKELKPRLLPDGNPWFSVLFAFQNFPVFAADWAGLSTRLEVIPAVLSQFALKIEVLPTEIAWSLHLEYAKALFSAQQMQELADHYLALLEQLG